MDNGTGSLQGNVAAEPRPGGGGHTTNAADKLSFIATTLVGSANPKNISDNIAYVNEPLNEQLLTEVMEILAPIHNLTFTRGLPQHLDPAEILG